MVKATREEETRVLHPWYADDADMLGPAKESQTPPFVDGKRPIPWVLYGAGEDLAHLKSRQGIRIGKSIVSGRGPKGEIQIYSIT